MGEEPGDVGRAVIAQDPLDPDAGAQEPGAGPPQERHRGVPPLVPQHLDVGEAGVVIDSHMHVLPASQERVSRRSPLMRSAARGSGSRLPSGTPLTLPHARKIAPCQALSPRAFLYVIVVVDRPRTLSALRDISFTVRSVPDSIGEEECMAQQVGNGRRTRGAVAHIALLALMMTAGCAVQSEMTELWKDPSFTSGPIHNVLVVALRKDPVRRRMWEDAFANELGARGLTATSSYQLFQEAPPDTQEVIEAVRRNGCDAVLVSIRLPNQTTSTYVPGTVRRELVTAQDYFGIFHAYWRDVQDPGHTETDEISLVQTDIWATGGNGRLIWSGTLRTLESVSTRTVETAVSKDIIPVLEKQGLIPKKKK